MDATFSPVALAHHAARAAIGFTEIHLRPDRHDPPI
jgi:hypothetical protein